MKTVEDRLHEDETPLNPFLSSATFLYPLNVLHQEGMIFRYVYDNMHPQTHLSRLSIFWKLSLSTLFRKEKWQR